MIFVLKKIQLSSLADIIGKTRKLSSGRGMSYNYLHNVNKIISTTQLYFAASNFNCRIILDYSISQ